MRAQKINSFTRGGNPYQKLKIGDKQIKSIGSQPFRNTIAKIQNSYTYSEYLAEQKNILDDFEFILHNEIMKANDIKKEDLIFPMWLKNIDGDIHDIQDMLENIQGILNIYTYSGIRLDTEDD